jgi:single-stranded DNA-specific DHH superfamily exonuclease
LLAKYSEVNTEIAQIMAREDIWGHGVEKPSALLTDIPSEDYEIMGNNDQHLKIDCGKYDVVLFNVPDLTQKLIKGQKFNLDAIGDFSTDQSYNVGRLQFVIKDFEEKPYVQKTVWDMVF